MKNETMKNSRNIKCQEFENGRRKNDSIKKVQCAYGAVQEFNGRSSERNAMLA